LLDSWQSPALVAATVALLAVDLAVLRPRRMRGAALVTAVWTAIGLGFAAVLAVVRGPTPGGEYLAGYVIERCLSLDNVFVFSVALTAFAVPEPLRRWAVGWAVAAALALRGVFIVTGAAVLNAAEWTAYAFGAFLIVAGIRLARTETAAVNPEQSRLMRGFKRVVPMVAGFRGRRLLVRDGGRLHATPLLAVLLVLAATDVVFAADSIPSIFAITRDADIVFAANAMALLGLQALFILLEGLRDRFVHLDLGLAAVLVLTGVQMAATDIYHPPVWATLLAIAGLLGTAALASLRHPTLREEPC
jgi:tellurite resistance protein TerC